MIIWFLIIRISRVRFCWKFKRIFRVDFDFDFDCGIIICLKTANS